MNKDNTEEEHKTKFWIYDPYVLLDKKKFFDLWPLESMSREEKLNAISKFVVAIIKKNLNINNKNSVCNALDEIIRVCLQKLPEALINNENNVELKEKSLQTLDFFSDYPQEGTNKPVTVIRFLLNVIEITEATEMSQELRRHDKKFLKAVILATFLRDAGYTKCASVIGPSTLGKTFTMLGCFTVI